MESRGTVIRFRSIAPALLAALCLVAAPATLRAQSDTEAALAEALYRQARDLMAAEKYDEACPKFAESYRLDRATGTLLNLGACHERQGKLASAWLEYSDGLLAARRDERPDRVKFAEDHLADLEPKLSRVTLVVPPESDAPGLEVTLDGASIGVAARGVPTPVDPGPHVVEAKAPGKQPFSQIVTIRALADRQTVTIPKLLEAPASAAPPATPVQPSPFAATAAPQPPNEAAADRPIPSSVYVVGGVTLALSTAAIVTGVVYLNERASYRSESNAAKADENRDSARAVGIVNASLWATAACGAAFTAYLYVTRPNTSPNDRASARIAPWVLPQSAGIAAEGAF
jgi:tetratricopeptide (TPR) repeat protein